MRILQIINDLRVAGAETLYTQLTQGLRARGIDAKAFPLAESPASSLNGILRDVGALLQPTVISGKAVALRSPSHILRIRKAVAGFDVVHVHLFPAQLWTALAVATLPRRARPILVTTEHNTHNRRRIAVLRPIEALIYSRFDRIVAISEATSDALTAWLPALKARTVVIPNGIDYGRFAQADPAGHSSFLPHDLSSGTSLLLCAGRLTVQKDQATAIKALRMIPAAHLCLAGVGEQQTKLMALVEEMGLHDRVHFLGHRDDLPALMKAANVYIQPSLWEGFGLAAAEAMAAGVPVVVSDVEGVREVVGAAGLLFPPGDAHKLAERVNQIIKTPALANALSWKGRQQARQFTLDRFVERHLTLYEELVP